jgi:drug/metabolite transporter (DMT)-like permease
MKILKITARILAIIQLILGTIHCSFTPFAMKDIPPGISKVFLTMFLATGLAFIFTGIVLLREVKNMEGINRKNLSLINVTMIYILVVGLLSVIMMWNNPFAWISMVAGVACSAVIFGIQLSARSAP